MNESIMNCIHALGEVQSYMPEQKARAHGDFVGMTLGEVAAILGVPAKAIWFFSVDGKRKNADYRLAEGEEASIHGFVDGGN